MVNSGSFRDVLNRGPDTDVGIFGLVEITNPMGKPRRGEKCTREADLRGSGVYWRINDGPFPCHTRVTDIPTHPQTRARELKFPFHNSIAATSFTMWYKASEGETGSKERYEGRAQILAAFAFMSWGRPVIV